MGFWGFLAQLAWVVLVAGVIYGFRQSISQALKNITSIKLSTEGFIAEFAKLQQQSNLVQTIITTDLPPIIEKAAKDNPEDAARLEGALERLATANNAMSSTLSGILKITEAPDRVNIRGTVGRSGE
jgi:hypothetical protein